MSFFTMLKIGAKPTQLTKYRLVVVFIAEATLCLHKQLHEQAQFEIDENSVTRMKSFSYERWSSCMDESQRRWYNVLLLFVCYIHLT
jgi:hypothetical protein